MAAVENTFEVFKELILYMKDGTMEAAGKVKRIVLRCCLVALILCFVGIMMIFSGTPGMAQAGKLLIIIGSGIMLVLISPALLMLHGLYHASKLVRASVVFLFSLLLSFLVIATFFYLLPFEQYPAKGIAALMVMVSILVSLFVFHIRVNPTLFLISRCGLLFCLILFMAFPGLKSLGSYYVDSINQWAYDFSKPMPRTVDCTTTDIQWFNPRDGRPQIWYEEGSSPNSYILYNNPGSSPETSRPLKEITPEIVVAAKRACTEQIKLRQSNETKPQMQSENNNNDSPSAISPVSVMTDDSLKKTETITTETTVEAPRIIEEPQITVTANPQQIVLGASSEIRWFSRNADGVQINGGQNVEKSGSVSITPSTIGNFRYILTATGPGGTASGEIQINVRRPRIIINIEDVRGFSDPSAIFPIITDSLANSFRAHYDIVEQDRTEQRYSQYRRRNSVQESDYTLTVTLVADSRLKTRDYVVAQSTNADIVANAGIRMLRNSDQVLIAQSRGSAKKTTRIDLQSAVDLNYNAAYGPRVYAQHRYPNQKLQKVEIEAAQSSIQDALEQFRIPESHN